MRNYTEVELWKDVKEEQWNDWKWQLKNRISDFQTLKKVIKLTDEEEKAVELCLGSLRMAITPPNPRGVAKFILR